MRPSVLLSGLAAAFGHAPDPRALAEPHPSLRRHELAHRGVVWSSTPSLSALERRIDEVHELLALGVRIAPEARVLDVGAGCGLFALEMSALSRGVELVLVEPVPVCQEAIVRNLREPFLTTNASPRTRLHRVGVAREGSLQPVDLLFGASGEAHRVEERDAELARVCRARAHDARGWLERTLPRSFASSLAERLERSMLDAPRGPARDVLDHASGLERVTCRVVSLASILGEQPGGIDLLRLDVGGTALEALEGIAPEQWARIEQVMLEDHGDALARATSAELLRARGLVHQRAAVRSAPSARGDERHLLFAART